MSTGYRQPIYLAKLKKREKQNHPQHQYNRKDSIQYDLMLFQQSLRLNQQPNLSVPVTARSNSLSRKPLAQCTNLFSQTCNFNKGQLDVQKQIEHSKKSIAPIFQKCVFNKTSSEVKNINKTQTCIKPHTYGNSQGFTHIGGKKSNHKASSAKDEALSTIIAAPQLKNNKGMNCVVTNQPLKQIKEAKYFQNGQQSNQLLKKAYQKIEQLQFLKSQNAEQIAQLQQVNLIHQKQNINLLKRIQHIERQLDQLMHCSSLTNLQNSQKIGVLQIYSQQSSQTEPQTELITKPSSTFNKKQSRSSLQLSTQDLLFRAKQLKNQLELQKIHTSNLQTSFKITLQNKQIEWRQKTDSMQRQIQSLNKRYESKCIEVKSKEELIARLIHK